MGILLLVTALLVVVVLVSRLTWWAKLGERRSVRHYEQAMDVLRSLSSRDVGAQGEAAGAGHELGVTTAEDLAPRNEPPLGVQSLPPHDTVRIFDPEQPAPTFASSTTAGPLGPPPVVAASASAAAEDTAAVEPRSTPPTADEGPKKPAFVFVADDGPTDFLAPPPKLEAPPSIAGVTATVRSRSRAVVSVVSEAVGRPRIGIAVGLATLVVFATIAATLVGVISSSSNRTQRVRQVGSPPTTVAPAPAPPPTIASPVASEPTPTTMPSTTSTTTSPPVTATPRTIRSTTFITSTVSPPIVSPPDSTPPPTTTPPPPTISAPPPTVTTSPPPPGPPPTSPPTTTPTTTPPTTTPTSTPPKP